MSNCIVTKGSCASENGYDKYFRFRISHLNSTSIFVSISSATYTDMCRVTILGLMHIHRFRRMYLWLVVEKMNAKTYAMQLHDVDYNCSMPIMASLKQHKLIFDWLYVLIHGLINMYACMYLLVAVIKRNCFCNVAQAFVCARRVKCIFAAAIWKVSLKMHKLHWKLVCWALKSV